MFGLVPIPLCVEVIEVRVYLVPYLSCVEVIVVLALCLASWVEVVVGERNCILLTLYYQILDRGSLCGRSCVDIVKIILCEGRDIEQWLESRNISWYLRLIHYL